MIYWLLCHPLLFSAFTTMMPIIGGYISFHDAVLHNVGSPRHQGLLAHISFVAVNWHLWVKLPDELFLYGPVDCGRGRKDAFDENFNFSSDYPNFSCADT